MNLGDNGGVNVEELLAELPTGWLYAALVAWSLGRSTFYYVSGRLATSRISDESKAAQVRETVARHGARSVLFAWPVPGLSAATQIANGAARVAFGRFAAVVVPIILVWSGLQTIFGVAVIAALASGAAPWLLAVLAIVVIAYVLRRRQRGRDAVAVDREESSKDHMLADPVQNVDPT